MCKPYLHPWWQAQAIQIKSETPIKDCMSASQTALSGHSCEDIFVSSLSVSMTYLLVSSDCTQGPWPSQGARCGGWCRWCGLLSLPCAGQLLGPIAQSLPARKVFPTRRHSNSKMEPHLDPQNLYPGQLVLQRCYSRHPGCLCLCWCTAVKLLTKVSTHQRLQFFLLSSTLCSFSHLLSARS